MTDSNGKVSLVGAGPGAPDLITVRGQRALERADVVLYDRLVHPDLVDDLDAELVYVGKRSGEKRITQERINALMVELAGGGEEVVRLKGGDPTVFGRGSEEMLHLREHGIDCEIIPGISSSTAAASRADIPVTHRGYADSFAVVTAHRAGDAEDLSIPPYDPKRTLMLLMGVGTMELWRQQLLEAGYPEDLPVAFVQRASWEDQKTVVTSLENCVMHARDAGLEPPATAVVGRVVAVRSALESLEQQAESVEPRPVDIAEIGERQP